MPQELFEKSFIFHLIHFSNYFMLINYRKAISVGVMIIRKIPESSENETSMIWPNLMISKIRLV
jgi:hypothetical protein